MTQDNARSRPANDNELTDAYKEFMADKHLYEWAKKNHAELVQALKNSGTGDKDRREQSRSNFIWFLGFEKGWYEAETLEKRNNIKLVKQ